ncbi:MAG: App1 family protein, partial [Thermoguttaceae bacterium]|nr:App1 family protein [Thermoguttaceae bacterium]
EISVHLAGRIYSAGVSGPDGHFQAAVEVAATDLKPVSGDAAGARRWVSFRAVTRPDDPRVLAGRVRLLEPNGLSVVSDIDDTIKISQVRDRKALVANTFLRPFRPVPGMADLYRRLAERGAAFHYVSASPWQLYPALREFCDEAGFPEGTFHLKRVRLTDSTALTLFGSQEAFKMAAIGRVLADFPERRFVLVGDTGEQDPEIFGRLARQYRGQIEAILLRNVTAELPEGDRMKSAREGTAESKWVLFREPAEIRDWVDRRLN